MRWACAGSIVAAEAALGSGFAVNLSGGYHLLAAEHVEAVRKIAADHVVDLGPEGGDRGGHIVAEGTPEEIASTGSSHTGSFLRSMLKV